MPALVEGRNRREYACGVPAAPVIVHITVDNSLASRLHVAIEEERITSATVTFAGGLGATTTAVHIVVTAIAIAGVRIGAGWL